MGIDIDVRAVQCADYWHVKLPAQKDGAKAVGHDGVSMNKMNVKSFDQSLHYPATSKIVNHS
jgi:hypothetical protein